MAEAQTEQPTVVRFKVMAFLCALSFLTYFDRVCIMRAQVDIQRDLKITDGELGWIMGAFWLAYGLFEIPSGWLGDKGGPRITLTRIVLAWSLFTALSGTATGFLSLLAYRFFFGVGEAGAYPNMAAVQSRWLPLKSRGRAGGLLWLCARWGGAFSPMIFGMMLTYFNAPAFSGVLKALTLPMGSGWRVAFLVSGLIGVVWCVLFYRWFRDDPAEKPGVNQAELNLIQAGRTEKKSDDHSVSILKQVFFCPSLWAMAMLYFCGSFGWSFFASWLPRYLKDVHQVAFERSELMAGLPLFCGGVSCLLGGLLSDYVVKRTGWTRVGRAIFPVFGCLTAASCMYMIPYSQTPMEATILLCAASAAYDFGQAANWATIVDIGGRYAGTAAGFNNMIGNMANFVGPVVGPQIFNRFGWNALFLIYTLAFVIAASMWLFIDPRKKFYREDTVPPQPDAAPAAPDAKPVGATKA